MKGLRGCIAEAFTIAQTKCLPLFKEHSTTASHTRGLQVEFSGEFIAEPYAGQGQQVGRGWQRKGVSAAKQARERASLPPKGCFKPRLQSQIWLEPSQAQLPLFPHSMQLPPPFRL